RPFFTRFWSEFWRRLWSCRWRRIPPLPRLPPARKAENSAFAQAPTGPQGGAPPPAQQQQNPDTPKAANPAQQPPQAGVTIAVDVPIVTLDVVATTQHGDIIPNLKKEN